MVSFVGLFSFSWNFAIWAIDCLMAGNENLGLTNWTCIFFFLLYFFRSYVRHACGLVCGFLWMDENNTPYKMKRYERNEETGWNRMDGRDRAHGTYNNGAGLEG